MSQSTLELPQLAHTATVADPAHGNLGLHLAQSPIRTTSRISAENQSAPNATEDAEISKSRTAAVIVSVTCITALGTLLAGILTVGIPVMAQELHMASSLQLW